MHILLPISCKHTPTPSCVLHWEVSLFLTAGDAREAGNLFKLYHRKWNMLFNAFGVLVFCSIDSNPSPQVTTINTKALECRSILVSRPCLTLPLFILQEAIKNTHCARHLQFFTLQTCTKECANSPNDTKNLEECTMHIVIRWKLWTKSAIYHRFQY